jgi:hypothetical protein
VTDLEELGYRLLTGINPPALSFRRTLEALGAAQRHREYHEVDIRRLLERATSTGRKARGAKP